MSASALTVEQIDGIEIPSFVQQNPKLLDSMRLPTFFASAAWFQAFLETERRVDGFGLVVLRSNQPIALLPLQITRNFCGGRDLRYLGYAFYPDPLAIICAENDLIDSIGAIKAHLNANPTWDRLLLDFVDDDEARAWNSDVRNQVVAPYLPLPPTFDALLKSFNGKKRYKLKNKIKVAEEAGLAFSMASSSEQKATYLDSLFRLHELRSKRIGRKSSLRTHNVSALHTKLAQSSEAARLFALHQGDRVVAVTYGFLHRECFFFFQITHDPEFDDVRPGTVIVAKTIEAVTEQGAREFNFLQGDEAYKFEWTQSVRQLCRVQLVAPTVRARTIERLESLARRVRGELQNLASRRPKNQAAATPVERSGQEAGS